jgi:hypothetical protein
MFIKTQYKTHDYLCSVADKNQWFVVRMLNAKCPYVGDGLRVRTCRTRSSLTTYFPMSKYAVIIQGWHVRVDVTLHVTHFEKGSHPLTPINTGLFSGKWGCEGCLKKGGDYPIEVCRTHFTQLLTWRPGETGWQEDFRDSQGVHATDGYQEHPVCD